MTRKAFRDSIRDQRVSQKRMLPYDLQKEARTVWLPVY